MPVPTRPVAGASIATNWGTDVHDRVFAPKGCRVTGAGVTMSSTDTTYVVLPIDVATNDPGGWMNAAGNTIVVPTGAEGLYLLSFTVNSVNGTAGDDNRVVLWKNTTTQLAVAYAPTAGATTTTLTGNTVTTLVATDILHLSGVQLGAGGTQATIAIASLTAVRIGDTWGA